MAGHWPLCLKLWTILVLVSVILAPTIQTQTIYHGTSGKTTSAFAEMQQPNGGTSPTHVPGRLLLKFNANVTEDVMHNIIQEQGLEQIEEIPHIGIKILKVPENMIDSLQSALQKNPNVQFVDKDILFMPQELTVSPVIPNDPYLKYQWHLAKIEAFSAWNISRGSGSVIAILDSGVEPNHPDLVGKLLPGYNFYDNNDDWSDIACKHGTVTAGVAAASTDNGLGVASIAWDSKILPLRVTDANCYASLSAVSKAIVYAADNGARVANLSFRIPNPSSVSTLADAYKYMYYNRGGFLVISAGNEGTYLDVSDTPEVIHVGATDSQDYVTVFSNYGPFIDFVAPGQALYTAIWNGQYNYVSGTSFSSPVVAGVIGLMFAANPDASPQQVYDALKQSAVDIIHRDDGYNIVTIPSGPDTYSGWGRINAFGALQIIVSGNGSNVQPDTLAPVVTTPSDMTIEAAGPTGSIVAYPQALATDNIQVVVGPTCLPASGSIFAIGATTVVCTASDAAGNVGSGSFTIQVVDSTPPVVNVPTDIKVQTSSSSGTVIMYTVTANDAVDGDILPDCIPSSGSAFAIGDTLVSCKATDSHGNTGVASFHIIIESQSMSSADNTPPQVLITNPITGSTVRGTILVSISANDASGISKVAIYIDNKLKTTLSGTSTFDFSWNTKQLKDGQHSVKAIAFDVIGNTSSNNVIVQVSNGKTTR
jgi:subtilisin family serine protease